MMARPKIKKIKKDTGKSSSDFITSDNKLKLVGTADPKSKIIIYIDGKKVGTAKANKKGKWEFKTKKLADDDYKIQVKAKKKGKTKKSEKEKVVVDTDADKPVITGISDDTGIGGDGITSDTTLTLRGKAEGGAMIQVFEGGGLIGTTTANASGAWSFDAGAFTEGSHSFTVKATDVAGNSKASSAFVATVDTTAPVAAPSTPDLVAGSDTGTSDTDDITGDSTPTFSGTAENGSTVRLYADGVEVGGAVANGGIWSITAASLAHGTYDITARIVDAAGNEGPASTALAVTIAPQIPPVMSLLSIADDDDPTDGFKIIGEATYDEAGLSVSSAGDVNGDGYDDLIIGVRDNNSGGDSAGAAFVVFGSANSLTNVHLSDVAAGIGGFKITGEAEEDYAGVSVSFAGDVNGDGKDDIVVGARSNTPGGSRDAGAAYVVFGSSKPGAVDLADIAAGTGGFKINGEADYDGAGISVSAAGDVNGDGIDDLIIGASKNDAGGHSAGAAYVVFGSLTPTAVDLADVASGSGGFKVTGEAEGDYAGISVSSAGDINGDGIDDLLIGAFGNDGGGDGAGAAYVVFGSLTLPDLINLDDVALGDGGFKIMGEAAYDEAGFSVSSAGDINGDGIDDLVVGAKSNDHEAGAAYVVFGSLTPTAVDLADVASGSGGFKVTGEAERDYAGISVSSAGDINGDGIDDLLIGAFGNDGGGEGAGAAYVVFGSLTLPDLINLDDVALGDGGFKIMGEAAYDEAGFSVSSAGDVNGDGFDDLVVGAGYNDEGGEDAGAAYVIYGGVNQAAYPERGPGVNIADVIVANRAVKIGGAAEGDAAGNSVSSAGDVNNDGHDDVIIGVVGDDGGGNFAGAAYVVLGTSTPVDLTLGTLGSGGFKITGETGDEAGGSVSGAGDVNGDGIDDLIVGADGSNNYTGAAYVVFGSSAANPADVNLGALGSGGFKITGEAEDDYAGISVSVAGDINGDDIDDLVVGASKNDAGGDCSGAAYVVFGSSAANPPDVDLGDLGNGGFKITGEAASDQAGFSVSSAGDVNGDGTDDLVIGAGYNGGGGDDVGAAYVVFGSSAVNPTDIDLDDVAAGTGGFKITGEKAEDFAGFSVSSAGDINGDDIHDIIVGARLNDTGGEDAGAAYVVFGSSTPTAVNLDDVANGIGGFKIIGETGFDFAGHSVSSAGDVNNDGHDDLFVGALENTGPGTNAGAAYLVFGSANSHTSINLSDIADGIGGVKFFGESANDRFGTSVAAAGDVNKDGFDDLIIGADGNDGNGTAAGAAYILFGGTDWDFV
ncbi:MAG: hypothetical protein GY788_18500 [bacterium]|nr:hypothetical protein [bacterium]